MIRFGLFIFIESRLKPDEVQQFEMIREVSSSSGMLIPDFLLMSALLWFLTAGVCLSAVDGICRRANYAIGVVFHHDSGSMDASQSPTKSYKSSSKP